MQMCVCVCVCVCVCLRVYVCGLGGGCKHMCVYMCEYCMMERRDIVKGGKLTMVS